MINSTVIDTFAIYSLISYTPVSYIWLLTIALWWAGEWAVNVGYYRLWYQESYQCHDTLRVLLATFGAFTSKGSIKEWLLANGKKEVVDPVVEWQHKYYLYISSSAMGLPVIVGYFLNDSIGGMLYGIFVSRFLESYALHWIHFIKNLKFKDTPQMLRSGHFNDGGSIYDVDKFAIRCAIYFGLAKEKDHGVTKVNKALAADIIPWKPKKAYSMDEFNQLVKDYPEKTFTIIKRQILDITGFDKEHPGGARYINFIKGIDGTHEFYGSLHRHSLEAKDWVRSKIFADLIPDVSKAG
jgi:hypothetical protein